MTHYTLQQQPSDPIAPPQGWLNIAPRLPVPLPAQQSKLFRTLSLASGWFGRDKVPDVLTLISTHQSIFPAWLWFASRLMPYGKLPDHVRELLILRTAWNCRSRYEWGQHVDVALTVGMSDAQILAASCLEPSTSPDLDQQTRMLLQICDELCQQQFINDAHWQWLTQQFNQVCSLEIMLLVGHYQMLAGMINSTGLQLEPDIEAKLQAFYQRISV